MTFRYPISLKYSLILHKIALSFQKKKKEKNHVIDYNKNYLFDLLSQIYFQNVHHTLLFDHSLIVESSLFAPFVSMEANGALNQTCHDSFRSIRSLRLNQKDTIVRLDEYMDRKGIFSTVRCTLSHFSEEWERIKLDKITRWLLQFACFSLLFQALEFLIVFYNSLSR